MKKRYIYSLLFMIPGLTFSVLITGAVFGSLFGALWLFVFGDDTWPAWVDPVMSILMLIVFFGLWISTIVMGYGVGKKLEVSAKFKISHAWISLGATILPIMIILLHQLSIGNLGPKSDGQLCFEYCSNLGYAASSMPPQDSGENTCSCLSEQGDVEITLPVVQLPR